jgi:hypothetical protein
LNEKKIDKNDALQGEVFFYFLAGNLPKYFSIYGGEKLIVQKLYLYTTKKE